MLTGSETAVASTRERSGTYFSMTRVSSRPSALKPSRTAYASFLSSFLVFFLCLRAYEVCCAVGSSVSYYTFFFFVFDFSFEQSFGDCGIHFGWAAVLFCSFKIIAGAFRRWSQCLLKSNRDKDDGYAVLRQTHRCNEEDDEMPRRYW